MSNMSNLDIVLSEYKLSDAQKNAVVELLSGGLTNAKPNTIKSLENKGLVVKVGEEYSFSADFETELKSAYSQPEARDNFTEVLGWEPDSRENETDVKDLAAVVQGSTEFDKFDNKWDDTLKITAGFGATLDWRGTEVWNGLTAAEIKEDMETAAPVNRKARRTHFRTLRNAFRRQTVQRPRKTLKITGKVGV